MRTARDEKSARAYSRRQNRDLTGMTD